MDAKAACDVVEEYLIQKAYNGSAYDPEKGLHCDGALTFDGRRYDCGDKAGYITANLAVAIGREDVGATVRAFAVDLLA